MPACSTCGYSVEWLRSCYKCDRAVFGNAPEIVLPGRYYFSPPQTPHYPGVHHYGSKNWMGGEDEHQPPLGEKGAQRWDNGMSPARLPLARLVGSTECIEGGAFWPVPGDLPRTVIDGIDSRCFTPSFDPDVTKVPILTAIDDPALQVTYAQLLAIVYAEDWTLLQNVLVAWMGNPVTITHYGAFGPYPARAYVNFGGRGWLVLISGTTTPQQAALQAFTSLLGPQNLGPFATMPGWNWIASKILDELAQLGAVNEDPIVFAGHSYGAALAAIVAARYQLWNPSRYINLLTYGLPKPGDEALRQILASLRHISIANHDDLVITLPPGPDALLPFISILPLGLFVAWARWRPLSSYLVLDQLGRADYSVPPFLDAGTLQPILADVLAHVPIGAISGHPINVYVQRLWRRQPTPTWPLNAAAWQLLFPTFSIGGGIRGNGTGNDTRPSIVGAGGARGGGSG